MILPRPRWGLAGLSVLMATASCGADETRESADTETVFDPRILAENAREAGPADGSFTRAGADETVRIELPGAPLARPGPGPATATLVVTADGETRARTELGGAGYLIAGTVDMEGDGVDEIIVFGSDMQQGVETGWATIVALEDGVFRPVERFDRVWQDSCTRGGETAMRRGKTIHLDRSSPEPGFRTEGFSEACPDAAG